MNKRVNKSNNRIQLVKVHIFPPGLKRLNIVNEVLLLPVYWYNIKKKNNHEWINKIKHCLQFSVLHAFNFTNRMILRIFFC